MQSPRAHDAFSWIPMTRRHTHTRKESGSMAVGSFHNSASWRLHEELQWKSLLSLLIRQKYRTWLGFGKKKRDSARTSAYLFLSSLDMRVFVIMLRRGKNKSCIFYLGIFWNSKTFNRASLSLNYAKKTLVFLWFQHTPFPPYALHSWN